MTAPTAPSFEPARRPTPAGGPARRIVLIASHAPSLIIFREHLIRTLVGQGHEVQCLAPDYTPAVIEQVEALGATTASYPLTRRGLDPKQDLASLRALVAHLRHFRPDVAMGYTPKAAIYGALAARLAGVPRIVPMITGLGYAFLGKGGRDRVVRFVSSSLYARALRVSHAVIFHNADDRRQLLAARILPPGLPAHVVGGSGVDLIRFAERPLPAIGDGLTFLMIARLLRYKGVIEYCEAARQVRRSASPPKSRLQTVSKWTKPIG